MSSKLSKAALRIILWEKDGKKGVDWLLASAVKKTFQTARG